MTDINDMLVFALVVQNGSFTKAADAMNLPKSNISRKITRLEDQLGVRLLERSTRSMRLTEMGQVIYEHCQRIEDELIHAKESVENALAKPTGKLKICTSVVLGQQYLAPKLPEFQKRYPDIQMDLQLTNRKVDLIEEGFDVVIRAGEMEDSNLVAKPLFTTPIQLFASPQYLKHHLPIHSPDDLTQHKTLYMSLTNKNRQWHLKKGEQQAKVKLKCDFICDDFSVLKANGHGQWWHCAVTQLLSGRRNQAKSIGTCIRRMAIQHRGHIRTSGHS